MWPKQTGGSYVIQLTENQTMNLMGPNGPWGHMGAKGPMGPMGAIGPKPAAGRPAGRRRRRTADGRLCNSIW